MSVDLQHWANLCRDQASLVGVGLQCDECAHLNADGWTCAAFPEGIPKEVMSAGHYPDNPDVGDHTKPWPGDHGIQFKQREGADSSRQVA